MNPWCSWETNDRTQPPNWSLQKSEHISSKSIKFKIYWADYVGIVVLPSVFLGLWEMTHFKYIWGWIGDEISVNDEHVLTFMHSNTDYQLM